MENLVSYQNPLDSFLKLLCDLFSQREILLLQSGSKMTESVAVQQGTVHNVLRGFLLFSNSFHRRCWCCARGLCVNTYKCFSAESQ